MRAKDHAGDILVVGPAWVGDMVMAQSLFMQLQDQPDSVAVDVVAPPWSGPLLARMPEVRRFIPLRAGHGDLALGDRLKLGRSLRGRYSRAIVLPRSWKSALVPFAARVPRRTGFTGEMRYGLLNDIRPLDRKLMDQTVKRYLALGVAAGEAIPEIVQPSLVVDTANRDRLVRELALEIDGPLVSLTPGAAYGPAKCWPLEYFQRLAGQLEAAGCRVWVMGSEADRPAGERISAGLVRARNLCGLTSLEDTVDLFSMVRATITNDSGLMHVAAAAGTHVVAIYGSSSPSFTPPLTNDKTIHHLGLSCSPCFQRDCPLGHLRCLREISSEAVFMSIQGVG